MNIEKLLKTDWWFNYKNFYDFISSKKFDKLVEVGVWKGHSISYLASKNKNSKIWAVDLFEETYRYKDNIKWKEYNDQVPLIYEIYNENLKRSKVRDIITDIKGFSYDGAKNFDDGSIDFVFIDADHSYEFVKKDIDAWMPKIRKGGILSGHDFSMTGVKKAVTEKIKNVETFKGDVWYKEI